MAGPGVPERRVAAPVLHADIAPTLLDILDLPPLHASTASDDGRSVGGCLEPDGKAHCPARSSWIAYGVGHGDERIAATALYEWPRKALWLRHKRARAYDLQADPNERRRLGDEGAQRMIDALPRLRALLNERLGSRGSRDLDPETRRMLESLGYL